MSTQTTQDYNLIPSVRTAAILTNAYVAGTVIPDNDLKNQLVLLVKFTLGNLASAQIKVEFSHDATTYYQETFGSINGGTQSDVLGVHELTADGNYYIPIQIKASFIKVSAKGTGDVTGSSLTLDVVAAIA